jgi:hypothetical protein
MSRAPGRYDSFVGQAVGAPGVLFAAALEPVIFDPTSLI